MVNKHLVRPAISGGVCGPGWLVDQPLKKHIWWQDSPISKLLMQLRSLRISVPFGIFVVGNTTEFLPTLTSSLFFQPCCCLFVMRLCYHYFRLSSLYKHKLLGTCYLLYISIYYVTKICLRWCLFTFPCGKPPLKYHLGTSNNCLESFWKM